MNCAGYTVQYTGGPLNAIASSLLEATKCAMTYATLAAVSGRYCRVSADGSCKPHNNKIKQSRHIQYTGYMHNTKAETRDVPLRMQWMQWFMSATVK